MGPTRNDCQPASQPDDTPAFFSRQIVAASRFCRDLAPSPRRALTVVCGGLERCASDYEIHRRRFPYCSIELVVHGEGILCLNGQVSTLAPGTVFSYGPDVAHDITGSAVAPLVKYFVDFTGRTARRLMSDAGLAPGSRLCSRAPGEVTAVFDDLVRAGVRHSPQAEALTALLLTELLAKIAATATPNAYAETPALATYRRCRELIERRFRELASLEQVAQECAVAPAYLCRLFRRFRDRSPYQFLLELKMRYASECLLSPQATVKQTALALGFADPFHFSRVFKKTTGISPSQVARLAHRSL